MLVMYTVYQSISETMTKTAYLKMIDYWLLFCLLTPFMIFMIETFWYLKKSNIVAAERNSAKLWQRIYSAMSQKVIRIVVPIVTTLFVIMYFVSAIIIFAVSK